MEDHTPVIEKPKFYYDPYVDKQNRLRTKVVCIRRINVRDGSGQIVKINYAYGSTTLSLVEEYRQKNGEKIALQRADKIYEYFTSVNYDFNELRIKQGKIGKILEKHKAHMKLLGPPEFEDLEKRLLPFQEKPAEEKSNLTALFDKADFGDRPIEEVAGIQNYDDKKNDKDTEEKPVEEHCTKCGVKINVDPNENQEH